MKERLTYNSDEFKEFCYRESERELQNGFATVARIPSASAQAYVATLRALDCATQRKMARAFVRRFFRGSLPLTSVLDRQEQALFLEFERLLLQKVGVAKAGQFARSRSALRKQLLTRMSQQLDTQPEHAGGGVRAFRTLVDRYQIDTLIDLGSERYILSYDNRVSTVAGDELFPSLSFESCLGISATTTCNTVDVAKVVELVETIATLARWFSDRFIHGFLIDRAS